MKLEDDIDLGYAVKVNRPLAQTLSACRFGLCVLGRVSCGVLLQEELVPHAVEYFANLNNDSAGEGESGDEDEEEHEDSD